MEFTHLNEGGRKPGKFAVVAAVHVALGIMFVHGLNTKMMTPWSAPTTTVTVTPEHVEPPPVQPPPPVQHATAMPELFIPRPEVAVTQPPPQPSITTEYFDHTVNKNEPASGGPAVVEPPAVVPPAHPAAMHTAVLADAKACALPEYPARSVRMNETGTTTLALLVGTDGRVTSARVEHSSGYRELDRAAVGALSLCRFKPATSNGVPEAGWAQLAYVWTLE